MSDTSLDLNGFGEKCDFWETFCEMAKLLVWTLICVVLREYSYHQSFYSWH